MVSDDQTEPGYVANPTSGLNFQASAGVMNFATETFNSWDTSWGLRVSDADLNIDADAKDTVTVTVQYDDGDPVEVSLEERAINSAVFDGFGLIPEGTETITATYIDANNGVEENVTVTSVMTLAVEGEDDTSDDSTTDATDDTSPNSSSLSAVDNTSMLVTVLAFLGLGGLMIRRKLIKSKE